MIKLTHPEDESAIFVPPEKVTAVVKCRGFDGAGIHSGEGFVLVKESPDEVSRLVANATAPNSPEPYADTELRAFVRLAEKGVLPSLDMINGVRRQMGYAELKELSR
jgi:hypothetical protein